MSFPSTFNLADPRAGARCLCELSACDQLIVPSHSSDVARCHNKERNAEKTKDKKEQFEIEFYQTDVTVSDC